MLPFSCPSNDHFAAKKDKQNNTRLNKQKIDLICVIINCFITSNNNETKFFGNFEFWCLLAPQFKLP